MSRTFKDRPDRIKLQENMKKGLIDHDHRYVVPRSGYTRFLDRKLSVTFYKHASKEINEYEEYLISLGDAVTFTKVEHEGYTRYTYADDWSSSERDYTPKTIAFEVCKKYDYSRTEYCTDAEHYDSVTRTDTRDGKYATCTPQWTRDLGYNYCHGCSPDYKKGKVKAALRSAARSFNAGDYDDYYDDIDVYERRYVPVHGC